jgi:hypothetical protein
MLAKHVALLTLLTVVGSGYALSAQPPDSPPDPSAQGAPADGQMDINTFYTNLSPYGHWVQVSDYGSVWVPFNMVAGWRPYTLGHWVMTDYGWTWVSDEPFGWAAYHYGRWVDDPTYGWSWVPGYDWGPAWVAWRNGGGYIGWAPLPPQVGFSAGVGLELGGVNLDVVVQPAAYCFVPERSFLEPRLTTYIALPARNVTIIRGTANTTSYTMSGNHVVNVGIPVQHVEQVTGKKVAVLKMASTAKPTTAQVRGGQLAMYRPTIVKKAGTPPPPPASKRAVSAATLAKQHQQESQNLQKTQAAETARLQQVHAGASHAKATEAPATKPAPTDDKRPAAKATSAAPSQPSAQEQQAEVKALQEQHQKEQQQLDSRHKAEVAQAKPAPAHGEAKPSGQKPAPKEGDSKRPATPPPS